MPFYGRQPAAEDVASIEAPLMIHYAGLDERVNEGWPAYSEALAEHQKKFSVHFYPDVNHGFHNDTTPRHDEAAATLAWDRTINFLENHLGSQGTGPDRRATAAVRRKLTLRRRWPFPNPGRMFRAPGPLPGAGPA